MQSEQQQRIMGYFIEEAKDHLRTIEQGLLNLQSTISDPDLISEVFRAAHSVKGGAAMLGLDSIQQTAHRLEDYFKVLKECPIDIDQRLETLFLKVYDTLQDLLEQLQGTFGLTEDKATEMMREVEPIFNELNAHLNALVVQSGSVPPEEVDLSAVASAPAAAGGGEALVTFFKQTVSAQLRHLLALFKQADTPQSRQQLQDVCQSLMVDGDASGAPESWQDIVVAAQQAIAYPENSYRQLAPVIIKALKNAQDLGIANRSPEIQVGDALLQLQPPFAADASFPESGIFDDDVADSTDADSVDQFLDEAAAGQSFTDAAALEDDGLVDSLFGEEGEEEGVSNERFDLSDSLEEADTEDAHLLGEDWLTEALTTTEAEQQSEPSLADSFDLIDAFDNDLPQGEPTGNQGSMSQLIDELDGAEPTSLHTGPQVGPEEMDSLADLFADESSNLNFDLSDQAVSDMSSSPLSDDLDLESASDFSDLLFDQEETEDDLPQDWAANEDDISNFLNALEIDGESAEEEPISGTVPVLEHGSADEVQASVAVKQTDFSESLEERGESLDASLAAFSEPTGGNDLDDFGSLFAEDEALGDEASSLSGAAGAGLEEFDELFSELDSQDTVFEEHSLESSSDARQHDDAISSDTDILDSWEQVSETMGDDLDEPVGAEVDAAVDVLGDLWEDAPESGATEEATAMELSHSDDQDFGVESNERELDLESIGLSDEEGFDHHPEPVDGAIENSDSDLDRYDESAAGDLASGDDTASVAGVGTGGDGDVLAGVFGAPPRSADAWQDGTEQAGEEDDEGFGLFDVFDESSEDTFTTPGFTLTAESEVNTSGDAPFGPDADSEMMSSLGVDSSDELFAATPISPEFDSMDGDRLPASDVEGYEAVEAAPDIWEQSQREDSQGSEAGSADGGPGVVDLDDMFEVTSEQDQEGDDSQDEDRLALTTSGTNDRNSEPGADISELNTLIEEEAIASLVTDNVPVTEPLLSEHSDIEGFGVFDDESQNSTPGIDDDLTDLDALLDEDVGRVGDTGLPSEAEEQGDSLVAGRVMDDDDAFADLDALLADAEVDIALDGDDSENWFEGMDSQEGISIGDDDFADLEKLLEDADQSLGGSPAPSQDTRSTASSNRRPSRRGLSNQTMRVSVKNLDNLNNLVGELVVNRNSLEQSQERLRQFLDNLLYQVQQLSDVGQRMRDLYERSLLESSLLSSRRNYQVAAPRGNGTAVDTSHATGASFDALEMDRFTGFHTLSQEMIELIVRVRESASDIDFVVDESDQVTRMFRQVTTQLQEGLTRTRMVPFAQAADRLPRAVRDISIKCGRQAELNVEGRDTLIDKMILEQLYDPMTHLVNNAITHGIESPDERVSKNKNPVGSITIRTFHQGNQTIISVTDDGGGIDPDVVTRKAIERGLITAEDAKTMSRLDVYDLLFHHGFSTRDRADDFAGRGVGMDVVRTSLSEIRGAINIDSAIDQGTTFTIRLPLTLSISKALLCVSNRARIAFPMDGVEDMLDVPQDRIQTDNQGRPAILWREGLLPFRPLSDLLKFNRSLGRRSVYGGGPEDDVISVVVLRSAGNYLALQVDQVLGEQEIVIKQLEAPIPKPSGIAGATVLGDGRIMPIADVLELIDLSMGRIRREAGSSLWEQEDEGDTVDTTASASEPTVLIVDDSITVRELLSVTFSKVGYRVEQARDGQEAWEKLRSGLPCDLVFCDIEMPRMDGLELLSRLQKDSHFNQLPIAMLTSRGADRHRQMAVQLGAKGYFTKPYLEEALLDAAQRMLNGEVLVGADS